MTITGELRAEPAVTSVVTPPALPTPRSAPTPDAASRRREGARREILDAVAAILARSNGDTFALSDVIAEMRRRGTNYAESTIRTMVTSHMCANAPDHAAVTYDDFIRVDRATYKRLAKPQNATPRT